MQISMDQSFFGRVRYQDKTILTSLKKRLRQSVHKILRFCRNQSNKIKKRNEYQTILFPHDYEYEQSDQISTSLKEEYRMISDYLFYLTKSQLFIDNYHLKIMKKAPSLPTKFDSLGYGKLKQFVNWVQSPEKNVLIGITDLNIILIISICDKEFFKYYIKDKKTEKNARLANVSVFKEYLFVFSQQQCHICKYLNLKNSGKGVQKLIQKILTDKKITKGQGIEKQNKFYAFYIVENVVFIHKLQMGFLLSKLDCQSKMLFQSKQKLINLQIYAKKYNNMITHIIIAVATQSQVKLLSYSFQSQMTTQLSSRQNPIYSIKRKSPPFIKFIQRQNYLLCAMAFQNRLYFTKIQEDYYSLSQRIRFDHPVEYVDTFGSSFGMVIITNIIKDKKNIRKIFITHEDKLISYSDFVYMPLIEKYQFTLETSATLVAGPINNLNTVYIHANREILFIGENQIHRTVLNTWSGIYNQMKITENIKLLKYLILLKHIDSPFLDRPSSFQGLEIFFSAQTDQSKQILIEYYHLMNMQPKIININNHHLLMIPFIIEHQVSNLNEKTMENLLQWCLKYDERLVQQLIVGGSQSGWEIAVSRGWIRAFKVMVQRGMQLQMPILKLYSMALYQKKTKLNQDDEKVQYLTDEGYKYLNQMVDYILFVLMLFFQDLPGNGTNLQFKNILLIVCKEAMWKFMISFLPVKSINIISYIFCSQIRIKEINKYSSIDFILFNKVFTNMKVFKSSTNSQIILSHLSTIYQEMSPQQNIQYLQLQHSKLIVLKFQEYSRINSDQNTNFKELVSIYKVFINYSYYDDIFQLQFSKFRAKLTIKSYFKFRKTYLIQILKTLARDQNNNVEKIYNQARSNKKYTKYEQVQCEMIDFMVFIWQEIYYNIIIDVLEDKMCEQQKYGIDKCNQNIKIAIRLQIKKILSDIQINISQYQYLLIHFLMSINLDNQFTSKIFSKFLSCKNSIIKQRMFIWLRQTLPSSSSLQDELIVKLKQVIEINNEESRSILQNFYEGKQKQIIKKIDNDPYLQLQYLQLIINNANEGLQSYYTNLHIELALKIKPQAIITILQTNNELIQYDIGEVLKMTLNTNDFEGKDQILIYLYEREGEIVSCIDTYLNCFENLVIRYIGLCEKNKIDEDEDFSSLSYIVAPFSQYQIQKNRLLQNINKKYQDSTKLLFRIPQLSYDYIVKYLRKFNQILKFISKGQYRYKPHYMDFIIGYFGLFIVTLFEKNCLIELSIWIKQEKNDLLGFILQLNKYLIDGYQKMLIQIVILKSMAKMQKKILIKEIHEALMTMQFCISSEGKCYVCDRKFQDEYSTVEALLFNCGHIYHKNCIERVNDQDFCFQCVKKNKFKSMIENQSLFLVELLKKFKEKRFQKKNEDFIRVQGRKRDMLISQTKKRTNRLGIFDKKMTAIENQAEIIDIKLLIEDYYSNLTKK